MTKEAIVSEILKSRTKLSGVIWVILRDHHATEDIFQDVVVKALARRDQFEDGDYLLAWARVSARNAAIDHCRQRQNRRNLLDKAALDALEEDLCNEAAEARATRIDALAQCLDQLPKKNTLGDECPLPRWQEGAGGGRYLGQEFGLRVSNDFAHTSEVA